MSCMPSFSFFLLFLGPASESSSSWLSSCPHIAYGTSLRDCTVAGMAQIFWSFTRRKCNGTAIFIISRLAVIRVTFERWYAFGVFSVGIDSAYMSSCHTGLDCFGRRICFHCGSRLVACFSMAGDGICFLPMNLRLTPSGSSHECSAMHRSRGSQPESLPAFSAGFRKDAFALAPTGLERELIAARA